MELGENPCEVDDGDDEDDGHGDTPDKGGESEPSGEGCPELVASYGKADRGGNDQDDAGPHRCRGDNPHEVLHIDHVEYFPFVEEADGAA